MTRIKKFNNYISENESPMTLETALAKILELEESIGYLKSEKEDAENDRDSFWDEIESLRSDKEDLESEVKKLEKLEEKYNDLAESNDELRFEIESLKADYDNLLGEKEELDSELSTLKDWRKLISDPSNSHKMWDFTEHLEDVLKVFKENPIEIGKYLKDQDRDPIIDYVIKKEIIDSITGKGSDMLRRFIKK